MTTNSLKIVYMGTPTFAVGPLKSLIEGGYNIAAVVTVPDKHSGRGQKLSISAVKEYALAHNLPVLQPVLLKDPYFLQTLREINADLFIVVAFRMLPKEVWSMPSHGTFNLHASLLPKYRGAAPINWAIIRGEKLTGITTFLLDENIDTGEILFQQECAILPEDNIGTLYDRLMEMGSALVVTTTNAIAAGNIKTLPQANFSAPKELPIAPKITRQICKIDWTQNAEDIHNLIRGLSPYPCAYSEISLAGKESEIKIFATKLNNVSHSEQSPSTISTDGKSFLTVFCGSGSINITDLQMAGKKRLGIREFLAGIHDASTICFK